MTRHNPFLRSGATLLMMALAAAIILAARDARMAGIFTRVTPGFAGTCKPVGGVFPTDLAMDAANGLVFIASDDDGAGDQTGSKNSGGVYTMTLAGDRIARVSGVPANFHPRALSLGRGDDGALTLVVVNDRTGGRSAVEIFDVTLAEGEAKLVPRDSIEGGLLAHSSAVAVTGPNSFYVVNRSTSRTQLGRLLERYALVPRANAVYFNGRGLRAAVTGLSEASGIALSPDGTHLYVAASGNRTLFTFETDALTGNLKQVSTLDLPASPDKIGVDGHGDLWIAAHPSILHPLASQILTVSVSGGIPQSARQVYANDGPEIVSANALAIYGKRLFIGSARDGKLLDCAQK